MDQAGTIEALSALAHEHRLSVYRLLVQAGPEGLSAGKIAEALQVAPSSLSFHLAHLHRAGLIAQQRESRSLMYSADFGQMNALIGYLTENCCQGADCRDVRAPASRPAQQRKKRA